MDGVKITEKNHVRDQNAARARRVPLTPPSSRRPAPPLALTLLYCDALNEVVLAWHKELEPGRAWCFPVAGHDRNVGKPGWAGRRARGAQSSERQDSVMLS